MDNEILKLLKEFKEEINNKLNDIEIKISNLKSGQEDIKVDINNLKAGQEDIKNLILDLEPKNGNRHVELIDSINDLRKDLSTVEIVTANNYADIAKLKAVK